MEINEEQLFTDVKAFLKKFSLSRGEIIKIQSPIILNCKKRIKKRPARRTSGVMADMAETLTVFESTSDMIAGLVALGDARAYLVSSREVHAAFATSDEAWASPPGFFVLDLTGGVL